MSQWTRWTGGTAAPDGALPPSTGWSGFTTNSVNHCPSQSSHHDGSGRRERVTFCFGRKFPRLALKWLIDYVRMKLSRCLCNDPKRGLEHLSSLKDCETAEIWAERESQSKPLPPSHHHLYSVGKQLKDSQNGDYTPSSILLLVEAVWCLFILFLFPNLCLLLYWSFKTLFCIFFGRLYNL